MPQTDGLKFLSRQHPYDHLSVELRARIAQEMRVLDLSADEEIYKIGSESHGLYIIEHGAVIVLDAHGEELSHLGAGNTFGERGLLRDGRALTTARTEEPSRIFCIPTALFHELFETQHPFRNFFNRRPRDGVRNAGATDLMTTSAAELMRADPPAVGPEATIREAAQTMRAGKVPNLFITDNDHLRGIVTVRDMSNRVVAEGLDIDGPVAEIMTPDPLYLPSSAMGSDVLNLLVERRINHLAIVDSGKLVGAVTQTDLMRFVAHTSAGMMARIRRATKVEHLAEITANIPDLLVHLVGSGNRHEIVTRMITDVADGVTRRLLELAQEQLGPAPVAFCWAACGSQGRQEQTGVSDQDNCLIIADAASDDDMAYFAQLARFVCDGLDQAGYVYCPGDMMATNPRWCQRQAVWQGYFQDWINHPSKDAQLLASVMFDLRVIAGDATLFTPMQAGILRRSAKNSIFVAHMASNALGHVPPLGLVRSFATIRSGEHRNQIDMKHNGVVPIVDLARIYALQSQITTANSRARIKAAAGQAISDSGARDLLDAYDLIAQMRLENQARQIKASKPVDNYLSPGKLSDFERSHLRDGFVVVKTMQSALMSGRGVLG